MTAEMDLFGLKGLSLRSDRSWGWVQMHRKRLEHSASLKRDMFRGRRCQERSTTARGQLEANLSVIVPQFQYMVLFSLGEHFQ